MNLYAEASRRLGALFAQAAESAQARLEASHAVAKAAAVALGSSPARIVVYAIDLDSSARGVWPQDRLFRHRDRCFGTVAFLSPARGSGRRDVRRGFFEGGRFGISESRFCRAIGEVRAACGFGL